MTLKTKIKIFELVSLPINLVVLFFYKHVLTKLLTLYFSKRFKASCRFFPRQGVIDNHFHFHFAFSDCDLGLVTDCDATAEIAKVYGQIKRVFLPLGELEIYCSTEIKEMEQVEPEIHLLYGEMRRYRQLNWIRNRLTGGEKRARYHRLKDVRKLFQLMSKLRLKSSTHFLSDVAKVIESYSPSEFVLTPPGPMDVSFYCDYLSQVLCLKNADKSVWTVLAALPPRFRHEQVDPIVQDLRVRNPNLERLFLHLNKMEEIIAKAYIRGCNKSEAWHESWLKKLDSGHLQKAAEPYCSDPFKRLRVTSEGDVFFCCFQRKNPIGNLLHNSIDEIRESKLAREIRESVMKGEFHKSCQVSACPHAYAPRSATVSQNEKDFLEYKFLDIDPPNSHCNIGGKKPTAEDPACIMCERNLPDYRFEEDHSSLVLKKIEGSLFNYIHIQGVSEPFFHDVIFNYLEQIHFENQPLQMVTSVTNGIVFDGKKQKRWLESVHRSALGFSIDAATPETYIKIRRLDAFKNVIKNIEDYSRLIKDEPLHHFKILHNINTINIDEVEEMVMFAKKVDAHEIEFNLTGGHPEHILMNKDNASKFIEAQQRIERMANQIGQNVLFLRPFRL